MTAVYKFEVVVQHDGEPSEDAYISALTALRHAMPVTVEGHRVTDVQGTYSAYHHAACPHGTDMCDGCLRCGLQYRRFCPDRSGPLTQ